MRLVAWIPHGLASYTFAFSRRECARGVREFSAFPREGRGECRVPTHPQPRMQSKKAYELVTTGRPDDPAFPHTMVLTVSFVISPVIGLVCHRRFAVDPQNLTPASRRQDHTTSPSAFSPVRQRCLIASIASRPASVTIASAPWWDETARLGKCFASGEKRYIFGSGTGQAETGCFGSTIHVVRAAGFSMYGPDPEAVSGTG